MNSDNNTPLDSLNGACQFDKVDPSPFSNKKSMYGKDEDGNKEDTHKHVSEEVGNEFYSALHVTSSLQ